MIEEERIKRVQHEKNWCTYKVQRFQGCFLRIVYFHRSTHRAQNVQWTPLSTGPTPRRRAFIQTGSRSWCRATKKWVEVNGHYVKKWKLFIFIWVLIKTVFNEYNFFQTKLVYFWICLVSLTLPMSSNSFTILRIIRLVTSLNWAYLSSEFRYTVLKSFQHVQHWLNYLFCNFVKQ